MKWMTGKKINVKHGTILQTRVKEEVRPGKWVIVKTDECPVESLGGAFVVESYLRPYESRNRRRMEWRPKSDTDVLKDGEFCDCPSCRETYEEAS